MRPKILSLLAALFLSAGLAFAQVGGTPGISGGATITAPVLTGVIDATGGVFKGAQPLCFEGATVNAFDTCFAITDPSGSSKTITFPNLSGTVLLGLATQDLGSVNAVTQLNIQDDDTANTFLKFTDVGTAGNSIQFQQDVNGPGWQVATTDGTTTDTLVQNENNFQVDLAGAVNADVAFALLDDDTAASFLTFTDVGTPANIVTLSHDVNTPTLTTSVASGAGTSSFIQGAGTFSFNTTAGATSLAVAAASTTVGDDANYDQIILSPFADATDDFELIVTSVDITGSNKTATFPDGSGTVMLTNVANNAAGNAGSVTGTTNGLLFEGTTGADGFEVTLELASDPTADASVKIPADSGTIALNKEFNFQVPDNANGGTAATYTYQPTPGVSVATFDCNDPQGCEVTVGETNAVIGQRLVIIQVAATAGDVTLMNSAGVCNLDAGANQALTVGGTVELVYINATWQQISLFYDNS